MFDNNVRIHVYSRDRKPSGVEHEAGVTLSIAVSFSH